MIKINYTDSEKLVLIAGFLDEMTQFIPAQHTAQAAEYITWLLEIADAGMVPNATPATDSPLVFRAESLSLVSEVLDVAKKWADEHGHTLRARGLGPGWFELHETETP